MNSGVKAPGSVVPETAVPGTAVPGTAVPDTAVPDTAVPDTAAPEIALPRTAGPEIVLPQTAKPETALPQTAKPDTALPQTAGPKSAVPEAAGSETAGPNTSVRETAVPETAGPDIAEQMPAVANAVVPEPAGSVSAPPAADPVAMRRAFAERLAVQAGETARAFFVRRDELLVERKSAVQDLVSQADREVEDEIRAAIAASFPGDAVLGEEHGLTRGTSAYTWIVDPIDGTSPFLTGQANWCVSIAVAEAGRTVCGVVHAPMFAETFVAEAGRGAFLNGRPLAMDPEWTLTSANVAYGGTKTGNADAAGAFVAALYREGGVVFRIGSGALMLCYVAAGRLAGYFDPSINIWDCAAGGLIVEEAGGVVDYSGALASWAPLWSGNARVVADLKRLTGPDPG